MNEMAGIKVICDPEAPLGTLFPGNEVNEE